MTEISTIIRARLDEGRAIADEDVLRLLAERDALQARCEEAERECAHQQGRADRNAKRRKGMTITTEAEEFTRLARLWSETFVSAIRSLAAERDKAQGYLSRCLQSLYPNIEPLPDLLGVCTQIDNVLAGQKAENARMRKALAPIHSNGDRAGRLSGKARWAGTATDNRREGSNQ